MSIDENKRNACRVMEEIWNQGKMTRAGFARSWVNHWERPAQREMASTCARLSSREAAIPA